LEGVPLENDNACPDCGSNEIEIGEFKAGFSGELETGLFFNTLYFYPAANLKDNPMVGKFAGAVEYNPK
jgi:hypothetical protein